jgi:Arc/MetJ-type ribon-helix-helix transcriptional regulator
MHVQLSAELELLITERISSGLYETRAEVIREALRMFFRAEAIREASLARFEAPARGSSGQADAQAQHRPRNARLHRFLRSRASARRAADAPAIGTPSDSGHATLSFSVGAPAV